MLKGTTPTFIFEVPEEVDFSKIDNVLINITSGKTSLEKDLSVVDLDPDKHYIKVFLTQEDTFSLSTGDGKMTVRIHLNDETALGTLPFNVRIDGTLSEKVIHAYGEDTET